MFHLSGGNTEKNNLYQFESWLVLPSMEKYENTRSNFPCEIVAVKTN